MTGKPESTSGKGKKASRKAKLNKETLRDLSPTESGEGVQGGAVGGQTSSPYRNAPNAC